MLSAGMTRFITLAVVLGAFVFAAVPAVAATPRAGEQPVDFERHLMGLFGRMGCNSGSCHGSFQGRGGFRLSLFGYDPEKDYFALTRENLGRRIDRVDSRQSGTDSLRVGNDFPHGSARALFLAFFPFSVSLSHRRLRI